MNLRRFVLEGIALGLLAILCGLGANLLAGKARKLQLPGGYPGALSVSAPAPVAGERLPPPLEEPAAPPLPVPATPAAPRALVAQTPSSRERDRPDPVALEREIRARFPPHGTPYVEVPGTDAAWLQARGALVLDARRTSDYEAGHIRGARSFPVWESDVDEKITALVREARGPGLPVVLYCSGGDCEDSHMLAQKLFGTGFENLLVYRDGWPDWVQRHGPVDRGPAP